ncbi:putative deoxyhypusine synthase [Helianthus annuus]|uniref:Deoxyhypusine synthase n=1 Tax=Helianthus annuus TaxID=4232 RepID=A0A251STC2_HELAN|nr:putative deoxyhypusine synthase [Helianthus annuus]KAJ0477487.1 putative deoxyhypusine synthase [Helianthus annuus]KAJ0481965.1 putative deoxyhypusine synthase [Helianthus annuus]KAJ0498319.1 putative deoxyhypusine synthase [Helianthus annuus]KAJ0664329.1 putative deoxyhypusine synthase [Helianthus annuus]
MGEEAAGLIKNLRSVVFKESENLQGVYTKINSYDFNHGVYYPHLLKSFVSTGFQASNLAEAIHIVNQMVCTSISISLPCYI